MYQIPDAQNNEPATPEKIRALIDRTGRPSTWCAKRIGVTDGYLRKLTAGDRQASYTVIFALECLASGIRGLESAARQLVELNSKK